VDRLRPVACARTVVRTASAIGCSVGSAPSASREGRTANAAQIPLSPVARFLKFYVLRLGFLDGAAGLVHILIGCQNSFVKYAKLMAMRKAAR